jgi:hypothetical protein
MEIVSGVHWFVGSLVRRVGPICRVGGALVRLFNRSVCVDGVDRV